MIRFSESSVETLVLMAKKETSDEGKEGGLLMEAACQLVPTLEVKIEVLQGISAALELI